MEAFLVIDMENDFMPKGSLGIKGADEIVPLINQLMAQFPCVIASKDWHPEDHCSFAASHPGKKPGDEIEIKGHSQVLWPVHCVRNTSGADFAPFLKQELICSVFYKGTDRSIDSYSAFFDNARSKSTGLTGYLKSQNVTELYIAGLTTDYCVVYSALDGINEGFKVTVIQDACRGINLQPHDADNALAAIAAQGGTIISSDVLTDEAFR
jgi:nicotinamidase/pyrazinamidase